MRFYLPENAASAKLNEHDMTGTEIKTYIFALKEGCATLSLKGPELKAGLYLYSLGGK